jgi:hypothetical protein
MVIQAILALPILIPLVPQSSMATFGLDDARKDYSDTVGWPELVGQVASAYQQLTPAEQANAAIVAGNYGEAGAINRYGPALHLPPALSPHLTFWYWRPTHLDAQTVVSVGMPEVDMHRFFADVTRVDAVQAVDGVHNEEVGHAILICRQPVESLDDAWSLARRFY